MFTLKALLTIPFRIFVALSELVSGLGAIVLGIIAILLVFGAVALVIRIVARWGLALLAGALVVLVTGGMELTDSPWLWGGGASLAVVAVMRRRVMPPDEA